MIKILDYGIGNIGSIKNMLRKEGIAFEIATNQNDILGASKIILPGNGSFDACIKGLRNSGMIESLEKKVLEEKIPFLGVCVGAQMLGKSSEEGVEKGLGWIDMEVKKLPQNEKLPLPHMGWNYVKHNSYLDSPFRELDGSRYYFVHSYYMLPKSSDRILMFTDYGIEFASAVMSSNIFGVQFHPEKSHTYGKKIFKIFASL